MVDSQLVPSEVPELEKPAGRGTGVTVVVPTYSEAQNLPELVRRIGSCLPDVEIVVVDDESPDGTAEVARGLGKSVPLRVIERRGERGLSTAVLRGLREARTEICVVMDADLSHPPEAIPALVQAILEGADLAVGSRYVSGGGIQGWPLRRRLTSAAGTLLAWPLTPVRDPMSGYFCLRRGLIDGLELRPKGFKILLEILARSGTRRIVEIPIRFEDRSKGASKFGAKQRREFLDQLQELYRELNPWPLRIVKFLCIGAVGLLPNLAVLNLLLRLGTERTTAIVAGWIVSMTANYALNRTWTFRAGGLPILASYAKYALGVLGGLGVQVLVMRSVPSWNVNLSALLGIIAGTLFNFLASQLWAFGRKPSASR
jgi:dolichol-phosphate mannosyltransferase